MKEQESREGKHLENLEWEKTSPKPLRDIFSGLVKQVYKKKMIR